MDAKAKVNEMCGQCTETHAYLKTALIVVGNQDAEIAKLIAERKTLITDHEAALAEQRDAYEASIADWIAMGQAAESKLTTLLTGLEALAGQMDLVAQHCPGAERSCLNRLLDQLRILTNSAKENEYGR